MIQGICVNLPHIYFQIQAFLAVVLLALFKNNQFHQKENSPTFVYSLSAGLRQRVLAALRKGEGSGDVFFYEHSSCYLHQDKACLGYPQRTEMEGERCQAVLREMQSREQAGTHHDLQVQAWWEAHQLLGPGGL